MTQGAAKSAESATQGGESIGGCQFRPLHRAAKHAELVSERQVLQLKWADSSMWTSRGFKPHEAAEECRQFRTMKYRPEFPDRFGCIQLEAKTLAPLKYRAIFQSGPRETMPLVKIPVRGSAGSRASLRAHLKSPVIVPAYAA